MAFLAVIPARAQGVLVSPPERAAVDDPGYASSLPLLHDTPRRYLQIHSDLKGNDVTIKRLSFRRDQLSVRGSGSRRLDCELYLGNSVSWDRARWVFLANYVGPRTQVSARRLLDLPTLSSVSVPAAFEIALTLDVPWRYTGVESFAWEISVYEAQQTGTYATRLDTYGCSMVAGSGGVQTGLGCYASGMQSPMAHSVRIADAAGTLTLTGTVESAPPSSPCLLMLGFANPNQAVPGLCSPLYTDLLVAVSIGSSDATGFLGELQYGARAPGGSFAIAVTNSAPGAVFYSQVHALDPGSAWPFALANSDGRVWPVPWPDTSRPNRVTRLYDDDAQPNGPRAVCVPEANVGYGVVVQFGY